MNQPISTSALRRLSREAPFAVEMHPVVFNGMTGWLHLPAAGADEYMPDAGIVLCSSLGREERCAHLPLRRLADHAAAAGFPVLRYDHPGQGDGADLSPDADAAAAWLAGAKEAMGELKRATGVRRVILGGLRIGASIAGAAAKDADGLILLAPVATGQQWWRQTRLTAVMSATGGEVDDGVEADGLTLSRPTLDGLQQLDLANWPAPPREVLAATQDQTGVGIVEPLKAAGANVRMIRFEGYKELFKDSHSNIPPEGVFQETVAWLVERFPADTLLRKPYAVAPPPLLELPGALEEAVCFGAGLRGVICHPVDAKSLARAVIFLNVGADPKAGIGRFHVDAARALARRGVMSLRFDFAGIGDSPMVEEVHPFRSHVFETPRQADLDAAIDLMTSRGLTELVVMGTCAGAFHAVGVAMEDPRIKAVFAVSPVRLAWGEGDTIEGAQRELGRATRQYMKKLHDPGVWTRFLTGKVDVAAVVGVLWARLAKRLKPKAREEAGLLLQRARRFSGRGGRLHILLGLDDIAFDELEAHFGRRGTNLSRLKGGSVTVVEGLDHGLARRSSRRIAMDELLSFAEGRLG